MQSFSLDQQYYVPDFTNDRFDSYPISRFRKGVSSLNKISDQDLTDFRNELRIDHEELKARRRHRTGSRLSGGPSWISSN